MIKKALSKAAIGAALAGGVLVVPGALSPAPLDLMACSSTTTKYKSCTSSTTDATATPIIQYGRTVELQATVTSQTGGPSPTGSVTFTVGTTSAGCTAPTLQNGGVATLDGSGVAKLSFPGSAGATCTYDVIATYGGDSNYASSSDDSVHITVNPRTTSTGTPTHPTGAYQAKVTSVSGSGNTAVTPAEATATFYFFNNSNDCSTFVGTAHTTPNANQFSTKTAASVSTDNTSRTYSWSGTAPSFGGTDYVALKYDGNKNFTTSYSSSCLAY